MGLNVQGGLDSFPLKCKNVLEIKRDVTGHKRGVETPWESEEHFRDIRTTPSRKPFYQAWAAAALGFDPRSAAHAAIARTPLIAVSM